MRKTTFWGTKVQHITNETWYVYDMRRPITRYEACFPELERAKSWAFNEYKIRESEKDEYILPEYILITSINHHYTSTHTTPKKSK